MRVHRFATFVVVISLALPAYAKDQCATRDDRATGSVVQKQTLELKTETQRVIRRDCDGKQLSDQVEVVTSPTATVSIYPVRETPEKNLITSVYNRTSCEGPGFTNGLFGVLSAIVAAPLVALDKILNKPRISVIVNADPQSAMHVIRDRENFLEYSFKRCVQRSGETCAQEEVIETGVLVLDVKYSEAALHGVKTIDRTAAECGKRE